MPHFDASDLERWRDGSWTCVPPSSLGGFAIDTRQLQPGQIFVALKTERRDGHAFLATAAERGAAAALVARADSSIALPQLVVSEPLRAFQKIARVQRERFQAAGGRVIGVTGSVGKTSTKNLLAALLARAVGAPAVLATEGNLNNHLGVPLTLTRLDPARHKVAVVEAGISEPGEMAVLAELIGPDIALITSVAAAHLAALGDVAGVAREKAVLAAQVRCESAGAVAIFPEELLAFPEFAELRCPCILARDTHGAAVAKLTVEEREQGSRRRVDHCIAPRAAEAAAAAESELHLLLADQRDPQNTPHTFYIPHTSRGMASNAVLAIRALRELGYEVPERFEWPSESLRGEWLRELDAGGRLARLIYLDCYNANPASMADALDLFYTQAPEALPRLFVLGGMEELGADAEMLHRALGRSLRLRAGDRVLAIGAGAAALELGARAVAASAQAQVTALGTKPEDLPAGMEALRAEIARWCGAVFLKGSRRYRLETLLNATSAPAGMAAASASAAASHTAQAVAAPLPTRSFNDA